MDRALPAQAAALPGVLGAIYDLAIGAPGHALPMSPLPALAWPRVLLAVHRGAVTPDG
jgi:hypothetical protein